MSGYDDRYDRFYDKYDMSRPPRIQYNAMYAYYVVRENDHENATTVNRFEFVAGPFTRDDALKYRQLVLNGDSKYHIVREYKEVWRSENE